MSANRSNIDWHLANMIGGRDLVPKLGEKGYAPGAVAIKSTGVVGNGIYINYGTYDSCDFRTESGLSAILDGGAEQTPYESDSTQNYLAGSKLLFPSGCFNRAFRYAKATNIITNKRHGLKFWNKLSDGVDYVAATAGAIGDTTITITAATKTLNQLRGGHLVIHTHTDSKHQFFGIMGNTATNAAGTITITLDGKLTHTITTSHGVEVWLNPYTNVRKASGEAGYPGDFYTSVAGIPVIHTTVANKWMWLQTGGPCWGNPHGTTGYASVEGERKLVFDRDGSVCPPSDAASAAGDTDMQVAGYLLDRAAVDLGAGSFMLTLDSC